MPGTAANTFEDVALPHLDAVYRMARTLARDQAEAEDLVQETFVRAFKAFRNFELRAYGAKPWLLKILHNAFYTLKGRQQRDPTLLDDIDFDHFADELDQPSEAGSGTAEVDWDGFDQELKHAVNELPSEYRTVLLLWSQEDFSYKEIADVCGCALGTVMSRLYRARQVLGENLRDYARDRNLSTERFDQ